MDYRQKVQKDLSDYTCLKVHIENAKFEIENELEPSLSAIHNDAERTSNISSTADAELEEERLEIRMRQLGRDVKVDETVVYRIDRCLQSLNERSRAIVTRRYMCEMTWEEIAAEVGYSVSQCKRIHKKAISRLSVGMYGQRARFGGGGGDRGKEERA